MTPRDGEVLIRVLREDDVPAAMRLKEIAHWNQTEEDWRHLLRLNPDGCFAATINNEIVATTTTTTYANELAWIGMVLVDPDFRGRGIATLLMRHALDYLTRIGTATIKLDATPAGLPVYEAQGFQTEAAIARWERPASEIQPKRNLSGLRNFGVENILSFDRLAFGADRSQLLRMLCNENCLVGLKSVNATEDLTGYVLARGGTQAHYIGPLAAKNCENALSLLEGALETLSAKHVYLDSPVDGGFSEERLKELGFVKQRDLYRMSFGKKNSAGMSKLIYALAGPEIG